MTDREEAPGRPAPEEKAEPATSAPAVDASAPQVGAAQDSVPSGGDSAPRSEAPAPAGPAGESGAEPAWRFNWDASSPSPAPHDAASATPPQPGGESDVRWSEPRVGRVTPEGERPQPVDAAQPQQAGPDAAGRAGGAPEVAAPGDGPSLHVTPVPEAPPRLGPAAGGVGVTPPPGGWASQGAPAQPAGWGAAGSPPPPPGAGGTRAPGWGPGAGGYSQGPGATPPFAPVPPRRGSGGWLPWLGGGCLGCLGALFVGFLLVGTFGRIGSSMSSGPLGGSKIGVVYVEGPIMGGRGGYSLLGSVGGADSVIHQLAKARSDSSIRAVVLRIDSPGGSAAASQEIWQEVMHLRRARKPVIASMGDTAASGGYYIASAADKIMANGSTLTGSIGVIMEMQNLEGLYRKIGIGSNTIKSGKYKDIGSSSRPMTGEEKQLLQRVVNDVYEQFVNAVAEGRKGKISEAELRKIADGRIFTGRQAQKLKLVDELGSFQDAIRSAARSAGISGEPRVVELGRTSFLDMLAGEADSSSGLRLPGSATEDAKLLRALRRAVQEEGSRAVQ